MRSLLLVTGLALLLATQTRGASEPALTLTSPVRYQVIQREGFEPARAHVHEVGGPRLGYADVSIQADAQGLEGAAVEFRVVPLTPAYGAGCPWTPLPGKIAAGHLAATARVPAGGWYRLELRAAGGGPAATAAVEPFGVGELFLISGQSYAGGAHQELLKVDDPQGRVVAYDWRQNTWQVANDPLPQAGVRGTIWPALGNDLFPLLRVPVGFIDVAVGGTASREWLPGEKLYKNFEAAGRALGRFRAVLWQQGESDVGHKTTAEQYVKNLTQIHQSLDQAWGFSPPWLLAKSTLHPSSYNNPEGEAVIRGALDQLWHEPGFFPGPDTDILGGENRSLLKSEGRHLTGIGQRHAGLMWFASVWHLLNPDPAALAAGRAPEAAPGVFVYSGAPVAVPEATFFAFDDRSIPFRRNLHLTMVQPEKHGASVVPRGEKGAFDELRAEYYGTVLRIGERLHLWYVGYGFEDAAVRTYAGVSVHIGYAESSDGIHWTKPNLGLVNYHGNTANNIVAIEPEDYTRRLPDRNIHIIYDPADPDATRRYKMMLYAPYAGKRWPGRCTMIPLLSADGLHWRYGLPVKLVATPGKSYQELDQSSIVMPAEHLEGGSLVRYGGLYYENGQNLNLLDGTATGRVMSTFWSSDFIHWHPEKALSFVRAGYDEREHRGSETAFSLHGQGEQVHEGSALWNRGNTLVGIYGRWQGGTQGLGTSRIDLGLISSVDAIHFQEPDPTFVFASPGAPDQWDSGGVLQGQGFQNIGGKTYFWYGSWNLTASGDKFNYATDMLTSHGEIGLMTLREDGFGYFAVLDPKKAQLQETYESGEGSFLTAPFRVNGSPARAFLNVEHADQGGLAVELLDAQGVPVPGYGLSDFARVRADGIRQDVAWGGKSEIPAGGPYRLRVALRYGATGSPRLYALYVRAASRPRSP